MFTTAHIFIGCWPTPVIQPVSSCETFWQFSSIVVHFDTSPQPNRLCKHIRCDVIYVFNMYSALSLFYRENINSDIFPVFQCKHSCNIINRFSACCWQGYHVIRWAYIVILLAGGKYNDTKQEQLHRQHS